MIEELICSYIQTNKRIVVPGFGAFIRKATDESVVFIPFLNKDDGVLVGLLFQHYGMEEPEAHAVIAEYIESVKRNLTSAKSYVIAGIGTLRVDLNGNIYLEHTAHSRSFRQTTLDQVASQPPLHLETPVPISESSASATTTSHTPTSTTSVSQQPAEPKKEAIVPPSLSELKNGALDPNESSIPYNTAIKQPSRTVNSSSSRTTTTSDSAIHGMGSAWGGASSSSGQQPVVGQSHPGNNPIGAHTGSPLTVASSLYAKTERPTTSQFVPTPPRKSKTDFVLILAVIAAIIAMLALAYGYFAEDKFLLNSDTPREKLIQEAETN